MDSTTIFSSKAEKYARYRWDYAPQAIDAMLHLSGLSPRATIADIGAGSGILTRHFIGRVAQVIAIEPNLEMRQLAEEHLSSAFSTTGTQNKTAGNQTSVRIIDASAEATTLPSHSVDLITIGTALNWFDPKPTRAEFLRILKPGGWLAEVTNRATGPDFGPDLAALYPRQASVQTSMKGKGVTLSFYFGSDDFQELSFPFQIAETWPHFLGGLASASFAPDENDPAYPAFKHASRLLFDRFSQDGEITLHGVTLLNLGQLKA